MEWKPIETAPKDGTQLELKGYQMGQCDNTSPNCAPKDIEREVLGCWQELEGSDNSYWRNPYGWTFIPTHWRLPQSPEIEDGTLSKPIQ